MSLTAILTETKPNRLDRSVRRAEERRREARVMRVCSPVRPNSDVAARASTFQGPKHLISREDQAILTSNGRSPGEFRINPSMPATDGIKAERLSP